MAVEWGEGKKGKKKVGLEGGGVGAIFFFFFARGLECAFANGITFTKKINIKDPGNEDGQPS